MVDAVSSSFLPEWTVSLFTNLGLYFVIFGAGYAAIAQARRHPPASGDRSLYARLVRFLVFGPLDEDEDVEIGTSTAKANARTAAPREYSFGMRALVMSFCTVGLLGSYLTWGVLQEQIMTNKYGDEQEAFTSSTFLVFCNRMLALSVAIAVTSVTTQPKMRAPFFKFSFTSLSNVLSSWCQLEALKYVSFPSQVLAKSSKLIPVMVMGKVISGKKYPWYEYGVAVVIALGVSMFMMSQKSDKIDGRTTTWSGVFILLGYLTFDSFTSQWQSHLFSEYKMSSYQMMLGVNAFSASLTMVSLLQTGELWYGIDFMTRHPEALVHILGFSITGATGQMFIFFTIKTFGPLVFTLIMTTRQLVSIILSCLIYGHSIDATGVAGATIVFGAVAYKIARSNYEKNKKKKEVEMAARNQGQAGEGAGIVESSEQVPLTEGGKQ